MTFKLRSMAAVAVLAAFSMVAAGCGGGASNSTTTTTTTNTASADGAGTTTSSTTTTTTASNANIPAECQAYLTAVQTCVDHVATSNPAVATQVRTQLEQTRASWAAITDQAALAQACTTRWAVLKGRIVRLGGLDPAGQISRRGALRRAPFCFGVYPAGALRRRPAFP
jgi:hypothetical protein